MEDNSPHVPPQKNHSASSYPAWQWNELQQVGNDYEDVAEEFSTLPWIMEGLLAQAGFRILVITPQPASFIQYLCCVEDSREHET